MFAPEKLPRLLADLRGRQAQMVRLLAKFTRAESPSDAKRAVDLFGQMVAAEWRGRGARVQFLRQGRHGDHIRAVWPGRSARGSQILVLGHLDTVYGLGTLRDMPFRVIRGRAFGPGVFDMKGGLVIALFA